MIAALFVAGCVGAVVAGITYQRVSPDRLTHVARRFGVRTRQGQRREQRGRSHDAPLLADLVALGLGAGLTPQHALELALRWGPRTAVAPIASMQARLEAGATFAQALAGLAAAAPAYAPLVTALLAAHHGAPAHALIGRLAAEARTALRRNGEERARRVPVLLLFPLIFLVLPAFMICTVAPFALVHFSELTQP